MSMESEIQVSKEDKNAAGDVLRVCEGVVKVNKCEGGCMSRQKPSINSPSGFFMVSEGGGYFNTSVFSMTMRESYEFRRHVSNDDYQN